MIFNQRFNMTMASMVKRIALGSFKSCSAQINEFSPGRSSELAVSICFDGMV